MATADCRTTLTALNRPVLPAGVYINTDGYRRYQNTREYRVDVDGVFAGEVRSARHSGSYGRTYWVAVIFLAEGKRSSVPYGTRAEAVAHLVSRYDAAEAPAPAA